MGEYITIIWEAETPSARAVEWDNCMLVVKGSEASLSETTVYACTADDWSSILAAAGFGASSQAYKSTANFFAASPTPGGTLYVLGLVSGVVTAYNNVPMLKVDEDTWETPIKPPLGWVVGSNGDVEYYPDADATGHFTNSYDGSNGVGFEIEEDGLGNWTGRLNFISGLSGVQIDNPPADGCRITCSFRVGGAVSDLGDNLEQYQINMMAAAYENSSSKNCFATGYFGNMADDLMRFTNAISGKNCQFFFALPGAADPGESGCNLGLNWENIKNVIGAREDVSVIKAVPSALNHDMAAGLMGMVAGEHPHKTVSFKTFHMGILRPESLISRSYWREGQVICPMERKELSGSPMIVSYGFTLGVGYSSRINYVRCKYIISQNLVNTLWALLASRKVKMSYAGMQLVKSTIEGCLKTLQSQGIIDDIAYVRIPIEEDLKNNTAAGSAARAAREIPAIEIGFYWWSSLEKITITGIKNEA